MSYVISEIASGIQPLAYVVKILGVMSHLDTCLQPIRLQDLL